MEERLESIRITLVASQQQRRNGMPQSVHYVFVKNAVEWMYESTLDISLRSRGSLHLDPANKEDRKQLDREHSVPFRLTFEELMSLDNPTTGDIHAVLARNTHLAWVTKAEHQRITEMGLRQDMPVGWNKDADSPLARYEAAGIELVAYPHGSA